MCVFGFISAACPSIAAVTCRQQTTPTSSVSRWRKIAIVIYSNPLQGRNAGAAPCGLHRFCSVLQPPQRAPRPCAMRLRRRLWPAIFSGATAKTNSLRAGTWRAPPWRALPGVRKRWRRECEESHHVHPFRAGHAAGHRPRGGGQEKGEGTLNTGCSCSGRRAPPSVCAAASMRYASEHCNFCCKHLG